MLAVSPLRSLRAEIVWGTYPVSYAARQFASASASRLAVMPRNEHSNNSRRVFSSSRRLSPANFITRYPVNSERHATSGYRLNRHQNG